MMRDALRVVLHDTRIDFYVDGYGDAGLVQNPISETIEPDSELKEWLSWFITKTYTKGIPADAIRFNKFYETPISDISRIRAEVTAPSVLELEITYPTTSNIPYVERATYCGSFQVWWKTDANDS